MNPKSEITKTELECIRFYMGDSEIVNKGIFKGGLKAYNTINALLHLGEGNEIEKIAEGKEIKLEDTDHVKSYIYLIVHILFAMEKYKNANKNENRKLITYRIDRASAVDHMKHNKFVQGFYSTCKWGFLEEYAHSKENIILLEIHRDENVPYLDFEKIFESFYAKPQEAEILLPFHTRIKSVNEIQMSNEEKEKYVDKNGNPPIGKYAVTLVSGYNDEDTDASYSDIQDVYNEITSEETVAYIKKCINILMKKEVLSDEDKKFYCEWKKKFHSYVKKALNLKLKISSNEIV